MCGEKSCHCELLPRLLGSPPRVRGKVHDCFTHLSLLGITPACAGKRHPCKVYRVAIQDHPRVCGEKTSKQRISSPASGSPPRVRGKAPVRSSPALHSGITPACAGKRKLSHCELLPRWDHPRVCGEKIPRPETAYNDWGSPPRVRGKAVLAQCRHSVVGITPACAGKRLKRSHSIGHFSCILCLFHSVLHRASASGGSRAGPCAPPCLPAQNAIPV